jgi:hypothetical protein
VQVALRQPAPNVDAVNAWIEWRVGDRVMTREVVVGGGHAGGHAGLWHLGIGDQAETGVRVLWPGGEAGPWQTLTAGGIYLLDRVAGPAEMTPAR